MGKKFMGLGGTDHFWDRAKAWILDQIKSGGIDKQSVIDAVYPVGSLYWSSKSTNPSELFGGTWTQIKDRFVLACGDTYNTTGATGGASTVTLSVGNMPSHNHTFTPSGTITMNSHSHGLNNHTHSFSSSGNTGNESAHESFRGSASHSHRVYGTAADVLDNNVASFKNVYAVAGIGGHGRGSNYEGYEAYAKDRAGHSLIESTTVTISGTCTGDHTHSFSVSGTTGGNSGNTTSTTSTGSFSGTQGTTSSNGSGTAFNILPPYVVKYCWERTA